MIRLSVAAEGELVALTNYYAERGRDRAIDRLRDCLASACARYEAGQGSLLAAPRPYPDLADLGFRWIKEGPYWIAFGEIAGEPVVAGIFHDASDIPNRL